MKLDCRTDEFKERFRGKEVLVIDTDAGNKIRRVIWADDETGLFEQYVTEGENLVIDDGHGRRLATTGPDGYVYDPARAAYNLACVERGEKPLDQGPPGATHPRTRTGKANIRIILPAEGDAT